MPVSGTFGSTPPVPAVWSVGLWTSQVCDLSLQAFPNSDDNQWGVLRWFEEGTEDEGVAYVRVDVLDTNKDLLQSGLAGIAVINNSRFNRSIDLSLYNKVISADIRIRFKLYSLTGTPRVRNMELNCNKEW